jgi:hypothetical protein
LQQISNDLQQNNADECLAKAAGRAVKVSQLPANAVLHQKSLSRDLIKDSLMQKIAALLRMSPDLQHDNAAEPQDALF